jgi:hypothetical protein
MEALLFAERSFTAPRIEYPITGLTASRKVGCHNKADTYRVLIPSNRIECLRALGAFNDIPSTPDRPVGDLETREAPTRSFAIRRPGVRCIPDWTLAALTENTKRRVTQLVHHLD